MGCRENKQSPMQRLSPVDAGGGRTGMKHETDRCPFPHHRLILDEGKDLCQATDINREKSLIVLPQDGSLAPNCHNRQLSDSDN
jgi:hypothetical protein